MGVGGIDVAGGLLAALVFALLAEVVGFAADELTAAEDETLCDDVVFGLADGLVGGEVTAEDGAAEAADAASDEEPALPASLDAGAGEVDSGGFSVPAALAAGCGGPGLLLHAPTTIRMTPISATAAMAQRSSAFRPRLPDEAVGTW
ncbi:MAG: hypothetical protein ACR2P2_10305 [Nakamurella sp.]